MIYHAVLDLDPHWTLFTNKPTCRGLLLKKIVYEMGILRRGGGVI